MLHSILLASLAATSLASSNCSNEESCIREESSLLQVVPASEKRLVRPKAPTTAGAAPVETARAVELLPVTCKGEEFFDCFSFFDGDDPTRGFVDYVSRAEAEKDNLFGVNSKGVVWIASTTGAGYGRPVKSIRLHSHIVFDSGLFILDILHAPTGPGTWPAWWLFNPAWPYNGEFDIFETVHSLNESVSSIHTSAGCVMSSVEGIEHGGNGNAGNGGDGAGVWGLPAGAALNEIGGGFFAMQWNASGFAVYFFPRNGNIPADISSDAPDTRTWGHPWRFYPFGETCPSTHFKQMNVALNLDFCGTWAGSVFKGGNSACAQHVSTHENPEAYWAVNSMSFFNV